MTKFNIPDMTCGHCKSAVEGAVQSVDASASLTVDLDSKTVEITSGTADQAFLDALKAEGYPASVVS